MKKENVENLFLSEKWRPKKFEDILGLDQSIPKLTNDNMPHLIFIGPPGTGKTTTAQAIMRHLTGKNWMAHCLILNASDERGIDTIRKKVKDFAITACQEGPFKIINLEEGDRITPEGQDALRSIMETYARNCRFIITGNDETGITDAIKSRCKIFHFKRLGETELYERFKEIVAKENIKINDAALRKIIDLSRGDVRYIHHNLQTLQVLNKEITEEDLTTTVKPEEQIWNLLSKLSVKGWEEAMDLAWKEVRLSATWEGLLGAIYDYTIPLLQGKNKSKAILLFGQMVFEIKISARPDVTFASTMYQLMSIIKGSD